MPISEDFKSIHTKKWEIFFSQCDPTAQLKLTQLANLFQLTASEHATKGGLGFEDLQKDRQSWVMNRIRIEIDELPFWNDIVEVETWIEILKGAKSIRDFSIIKNGKKLVNATSLWAVFNTEKRRPDILQIDSSHIERFPDRKATKQEISILEKDFEAHFKTNYKVKFSDLDIVNHVNNTKYLEWCLDIIEPEILFKHQIKAIEMIFLKELNLFDEIEINHQKNKNGILFRIQHQDKINFLCNIEL